MNQGQCGSCWAFSMTGTLEGVLAVGTGWTQTMSEQQILDCNTWGSGCQGGTQRPLRLQCSCDMTSVKDGWGNVVTKELEEGCEIHKPNRHNQNNHRTSKHASTSWRSDGSPSCLGGSSHGWVPVKTHSTPVPTSVVRLWVAHQHSNTQQ